MSLSKQELAFFANAVFDYDENHLLEMSTTKLRQYLRYEQKVIEDFAKAYRKK